MDIEKAIELEKLHRHVFDKIYVQNKEKGKDDDAVLEKYNELVASYPTFRQDLYDFDKNRYIRYKYFKTQ